MRPLSQPTTHKLLILLWLASLTWLFPLALNPDLKAYFTIFDDHGWQLFRLDGFIYAAINYLARLATNSFLAYKLLVYILSFGFFFASLHIVASESEKVAAYAKYPILAPKSNLKKVPFLVKALYQILINILFWFSLIFMFFLNFQVTIRSGLSASLILFSLAILVHYEDYFNIVPIALLAALFSIFTHKASVFIAVPILVMILLKRFRKDTINVMLISVITCICSSVLLILCNLFFRSEIDSPPDVTRLMATILISSSTLYWYAKHNELQHERYLAILYVSSAMLFSLAFVSLLIYIWVPTINSGELIARFSEWCIILSVPLCFSSNPRISFVSRQFCGLLMLSSVKMFAPQLLNILQ